MKRVNFNQRYPPGSIGDQGTRRSKRKIFLDLRYSGHVLFVGSLGSHVQTGTLSVT